MNTDKWASVEGMIVARELEPSDVSALLRDQALVSKLVWYEETPNLLGITMIADDQGHAATMSADGSQLTAGATLRSIAEELASLFDAEVRLGSECVDCLEPIAESFDEHVSDPNESSDDLHHHATGNSQGNGVIAGQDEDRDASTVGADLHGDAHTPIEDQLDDEISSRIVEIGNTPISSIPLIAALERIPLGVLELGDGSRALLADIPAARNGWNFGDVPFVTLSMTDGEFEIRLVTDDHLEHVISYNWGMNEEIIPGAQEEGATLPLSVEELLGSRNSMETIALMVPYADSESLISSTKLRGEDAVRAVMDALILPQSVADFLLGDRDIDEIDSVDIHWPRGISNAIGRSVDIMLREREQPEGPSKLWDTYCSTAIERPWLIHAFTATEATIGAFLLGSTFRSPKPRSGWAKFAGVAGTLMLADSVANTCLAKYVRLREARHLADTGDNEH